MKLFYADDLKSLLLFNKYDDVLLLLITNVGIGIFYPIGVCVVKQLSLRP